MKSTIPFLPPELLVLIFQYVSGEDGLEVVLTCKEWAQAFYRSRRYFARTHWAPYYSTIQQNPDFLLPHWPKDDSYFVSMQNKIELAWLHNILIYRTTIRFVECPAWLPDPLLALLPRILPVMLFRFVSIRPRLTLTHNYFYL